MAVCGCQTTGHEVNCPTRLFPETPSGFKPMREGWICPRCNRTYAPWFPRCDRCDKEAKESDDS